MVCDSIVNSGTTLHNIRNYLLTKGVSTVKTLGLIIRNQTGFIPNFYAMVIDVNDQVFFGRSRYPVQAFKCGIIRRVSEVDKGKTIDVGVDWVYGKIDDYLYDSAKDKSYRTYVIEPENEQKIVGVLHFKDGENGNLFLDVIAIDKQYQNRGYATSLLRFLEEYKQINNYRGIIILAIEDKCAFYERFGYKKTGKLRELAYGKFCQMEKTEV